MIKATLRGFTVENLKVKDRETQLVIQGVKVIVILKLIDPILQNKLFSPVVRYRSLFHKE